MRKIAVQCLVIALLSLGGGLVFNHLNSHRLPVFRDMADPARGASENPVETRRAGSTPDGFQAATVEADPVTSGGSLGRPAARHSRDGVLQYVTSSTAKALYDSGEVMFIDAREADEFKTGRVPNAQRLSPSDFRQGKPDLLDYLPEDEAYVVYCRSSRECGAAEIVARQMKIYGYKNVRVFRGGWEEWTKAGWPKAADEAATSETTETASGETSRP